MCGHADLSMFQMSIRPITLLGRNYVLYNFTVIVKKKEMNPKKSCLNIPSGFAINYPSLCCIMYVFVSCCAAKKGDNLREEIIAQIMTKIEFLLG